MASPSGTIVPASAASGSVVGRPSASSAQPTGIGSPRALAATMAPRATAEVDRSTTIGARPGSGQAKAIGLVPKVGRDPPHGAIAAGVLANRIATSPRAASASTGRPAAPQWCERRMGAAASPCARAMSGRWATAASSAG